MYSDWRYARIDLLSVCGTGKWKVLEDKGMISVFKRFPSPSPSLLDVQFKRLERSLLLPSFTPSIPEGKRNTITSVHLSIRPSCMRAFDSFCSVRDDRSSAKKKLSQADYLREVPSFLLILRLRHSFQTAEAAIVIHGFSIFVLRERNDR